MADSENWAVEWLKRRRGAMTTEESATQSMLLEETDALAERLILRRERVNDRWQAKQVEMFEAGVPDTSQRWQDERDAYLASMEDLKVRQKAVTVFTNRLSN